MNEIEQALKFLEPEDWRSLGTRIYRCDVTKLRSLLTAAACPVVCLGYLDGDENWHQLCIDKADAALKALGVVDQWCNPRGEDGK